MNLMIVTGYDDAMAPVGEIARDSWSRYAACHGYQFLCAENIDWLSEGRHPSWAKLRLLRSCFAQLPDSIPLDLVLWVDADTAVFNHEVRIEDIVKVHSDSPLLVGRDWAGACCAHLFLRRHPWVLSFLDAWWLLGDSDEWKRWHPAPKQEQDAFKCMLEFFPEVRNRVALLEEGVICQVGDPLPNCWAVHASGKPDDARIRRLRQWCP